MPLAVLVPVASDVAANAGWCEFNTRPHIVTFHGRWFLARVEQGRTYRVELEYKRDGTSGAWVDDESYNRWRHPWIDVLYSPWSQQVRAGTHHVFVPQPAFEDRCSHNPVLRA